MLPKTVTEDDTFTGTLKWYNKSSNISNKNDAENIINDFGPYLYLQTILSMKIFLRPWESQTEILSTELSIRRNQP